MRGVFVLQRWASTFKFRLPDLGEKIKEGTIKKLYVRQDQQVNQFDKIADVESDKQFTEITAPRSGVIRKLLYGEGQACQVGQVFLQMDDEGQTPQSQEPIKQHKNIAKQKHHSDHQKQSHPETLASKTVQMYARRHNINLKEVRGTGKKGRVLKEDIFAFIQAQAKLPKKAQREENQHKQSHSSTFSMQVSQSNKLQQENSLQLQPTAIKMNNYQKGMQKSMSESANIPHLYYHQDYNMNHLQQIRAEFKLRNQKVTIMGILIKLFSQALTFHPKINSLYDPSNPFAYKVFSQHNISIAIDSPHGLLVPNIKSVNSKPLKDIQMELLSLQKKAQEGKLTANDLNQGTICLSNIGTIGGVSANPLILSPQVCIVAIGRMREVITFHGAAYHKTKMVNFTFGCDHRVIDGATAARFSNQWKTLVECPSLSMLSMV